MADSKAEATVIINLLRGEEGWDVHLQVMGEETHAPEEKYICLPPGHHGNDMLVKELRDIFRRILA